MRALIIDDSKTMRSILRNMLVSMDFEVIEAANGLEGLQRLTTDERVDLALVDWNMPIMNGLEFVAALRSDYANADVRVLMVSTENDMTKIARALMAGADDYAMKPITKEIIVEKLEIMGMFRRA